MLQTTRKSISGERDPTDRIPIDVHQARLALDDFSLPRQFVERHAALLDGRNHRRHLVKIAGVFFKRGAHVGIIQRRDGTFFTISPALSCVSVDDAEYHRPGIFLVLAHEQVLDFRSASERQKEQAGRDGIQRAAMSNLLDLKPSPNDCDDIVRCHSGRLVDEENAVRSCSQ